MELTQSLQLIPAAVIGLTLHEYSHAYAAYCLGDNTAKEQGRLTLNPLKHIDWIGFFLIIIAGFGWAKPVQFNPNNLKNKHRDEILISLAGPASNLLLAIAFFVIARSLLIFPFFHGTEFGIQVVSFLVISGVINIGLCVFNLLPIPPLDGSHTYLTFLKDENPKLMTQLYRWGTWGLLMLILVENNTDINILHLSDMINGITGFFMRLLFL